MRSGTALLLAETSLVGCVDLTQPDVIKVDADPMNALDDEKKFNDPALDGFLRRHSTTGSSCRPLGTGPEQGFALRSGWEREGQFKRCPPSGRPWYD